MTKTSFWAAALALVLAGATGTPAVASGYATDRIELAGQPWTSSSPPALRRISR